MILVLVRSSEYSVVPIGWRGIFPSLQRMKESKMFLPNEFAKVYEPESGLHQNDGRYFSNLRVIKEKAIPAQSGMASSNANGNRSKGFLTPW